LLLYDDDDDDQVIEIETIRGIFQQMDSQALTDDKPMHQDMLHSN
jgi:hypothetical protein